VLGLGNPLRGDDGVGASVVQRLRRSPMEENVLLEEAGGDDLAVRMIGRHVDRILVVDAADLRRPPGAWVRFSGERLLETTPEVRRLSHGLGLIESIGLGKALGVPAVPIIVYGIQPEFVGWAAGLSATARRAVRQVVRAVRQELGSSSPPRRKGRCSGWRRKSVPAAERQGGVSKEREESHGQDPCHR
jgi:hydrogenase maturation protease